jgi:hypothetical protein
MATRLIETERTGLGSYSGATCAPTKGRCNFLDFYGYLHLGDARKLFCDDITFERSLSRWCNMLKIAPATALAMCISARRTDSIR